MAVMRILSRHPEPVLLNLGGLRDWPEEGPVGLSESVRAAGPRPEPVAVCGIGHLPHHPAIGDLSRLLPVYADQDSALTALALARRRLP